MTSRRSARTVAGLAVAALAVLALAGCDGDDDPAASDSSEPAAVDPSESETSESTGDTPPAEPSDPPESSQPADDGATVESAVERFERFMHAYGRGNADAVCEIGEEAIIAGFGNQIQDCARAVALGRRFNGPRILASLRGATVDPSQAVQVAPDRVEIPRSAISEGAALFTAADDRVAMVWAGGDWTVSPD